MNAVNRTVEMLIRNEAHTATKYLKENQIVRATRIGRINKRDSNIDIRLTLGRPNYAERHFVKACKKAGEPFPVQRVQLKYYPKKK